MANRPEERLIFSSAELALTAENCPKISDETIAEVARRIDQDVVAALNRLPELMSCIIVINELNNLSDAIYDVREREGEGWDGPEVTAYSNAITKLRMLLKEGGVSLP